MTKRYGEGGIGKNICPICGKVEQRYFLGSWDWEPNECLNCIVKKFKNIK